MVAPNAITGSAGLGVDYSTLGSNRRQNTSEAEANATAKENKEQRTQEAVSEKIQPIRIHSKQVISGDSAQQVLSSVMAQVRACQPWQLEEVQVVVERTLIPSAYV